MVGRRRINPVVAVAALALAPALVAGVAGCGGPRAGDPGPVALVSAPGSPSTPGAEPGTGATVPDRCPAGMPKTLVTNEPGADHSLVPQSADRLRLCAYRPTDADPAPVRLAVQVLVTDPAVVERLRSALDRAEPPPSGTYNCPAVRGYAVLEVFSDTARTRMVEVDQQLDGCRPATNGRYEAWSGPAAPAEVVTSLLPAAYRNEAPRQ
ncbi:hypothetical protein [Streptacidiphilus cavernicola]|uniref:DUF3558 domain-containing protein n=1 Tax=Streptacidiphilus cavernicola TaxID=3342716 RepID=A0ABV6VXP8_9ACTN